MLKNSLIIKCIPLILLALAITACGNKNNNLSIESSPTESEMIAIALEDNISLRIDPFAKSARISTIPRGAKVKVLTRSFEKADVDRKRDFWYKIETNDKVTGWAFGGYLKIFEKGSDSAASSLISSLNKEESEAAQKNLAGRWWSVNDKNIFTDQCLDIYEDGSYRSYLKEKLDTPPTDGTIQINFESKEIVFSKGTTFGTQINFSNAASSYYLELKQDNKTLKFNKVALLKEKTLPKWEPKVVDPNSSLEETGLLNQPATDATNISGE